MTSQCKDCNESVTHEWYMVHDHVWKSAGMKFDDGFLCIGCLEKRLGRRLHSCDFEEIAMNEPDEVNNSARLNSRLLDFPYDDESAP